MQSRLFDIGTKLPSLDPFYRIILTWNFYKDVSDDRFATLENENLIITKSLQGVTGPHSNVASLTNNSSTVSTNNITSLPTQFSSEDDYIQRFFPLFLLESKQMIHRAKEMELGSPEIIVQVSAAAVDGFILLTFERGNNYQTSIFTSDLCLLYLDNHIFGTSLDDTSLLIPTDPKIENENHILAVIESSVQGELVAKIMIPSISSDDTEAALRYKMIAEAINTSRQKWYFARIMGMSTINREYQALMSFSDLFLKEDLLLSGTDPIVHVLKSLKLIEEQKKKIVSMAAGNRKACMKRLLAMEKKKKRQLKIIKQMKNNLSKEILDIPTPLKKTLESLYNESQFSALQDCLKASGITLIKGPPGTGKTTTIVGVLSVILNASVKQQSTVNCLSDPNAVSDSDSQSLLHNSGIESQTVLEKQRAAQPWIYNTDYVPWYDTVSLLSEDLEKYTYKEACDTDGLIDLSHVHLESQPRRVLVCAPSNAAIDEILKRLTADPLKGGGILDAQGDRYTPAVVRVGPNIHPDLIPYALETRTTARLQALGSASTAARDAVKSNILSESRIVCSTLSICGSRELTSFAQGFDTVVIDEASQGVELSTLIPLRLGCRRLILVGDPQQLPATVFSRICILQNYDQSLFQRLERAGHRINMLSVQYRMHPSISHFPSMTFYNGELLDAPGLEHTVIPPISWYKIPLFRPIVFYAIDSQETSQNTSLINTEEAMFICQFIELLGMMLSHLPGYKDTWQQKIAIISPYAEQVRYIRRLLKVLLQVGSNKPCPIDVNTVDGYQGREKDFVIFSSVRAQFVTDDIGTETNRKTNVGFLADLRRMNVALTRARCNLWVVGNARYLTGNPEWAKFCRYSTMNDFDFNVNYKKLPKNGYLKRWLNQYLKRSPESLNLLLHHMPLFVESLEKEVNQLVLQDKILAERPTEDNRIVPLSNDTQVIESTISVLDEGDIEVLDI